MHRVTSEPCWRWVQCDGHNGMERHYRSFTHMFVILADTGGLVGTTELVMIDRIKTGPHGARCLNFEHYKQGPRAHTMFFYACVR